MQEECVCVAEAGTFDVEAGELGEDVQVWNQGQGIGWVIWGEEARTEAEMFEVLATAFGSLGVGVSVQVPD